MALMIETEPVPLAAGPDGTVRIRQSDVEMRSIVGAFQEGVPAEEIARRYPSLHPADVYMVIGYYLRHRPEVDSHLRTDGLLEARQGAMDAIGRLPADQIEFDVVVRMPPVRERYTRLRVEGRAKASPRVVEPEIPDGDGTPLV